MNEYYKATTPRATQCIDKEISIRKIGNIDIEIAKRIDIKLLMSILLNTRRCSGEYF